MICLIAFNDLMREYTLFFQLIQVALGIRDALETSPSRMVWEAMYETAKKQAVAGIAFSAI